MLTCPAIGAYTDPQTYNAAQLHYAIGSMATLDVYWTDAGSVKHKWKIGVVLLRCLEAMAVTGGIPVALSYNATYGRGAVDTYAAADLTHFFGLTLTYSAALAAGDLAWFQCMGPNYVATAASAAVSSLANLQHTTSGQDLKTATDFDNAFGFLAGPALGGAAAIPAGDMILTNKLGFVAH